MDFNFVTYMFFKNGGFLGGSEIYLQDLSSFLMKKGHNVTIITGFKKEENFYFNEVKVKTIKIPLSPGRVIFNFLWKKYINEADYVHLNNIFHAYPFATSNMTGTCHGLTFDLPYFGLSRSARTQGMIRNFIHEFMIKKAIIKLKKIVSVDNYLLKYVQIHMKKYARKIYVIPNYANPKLFNNEVQVNQKKTPLRNDKMKILFPRNLFRNRGIVLMMNAFKLLAEKYDNLQLVIAGTGPYKNYVEMFIKKNNFEDIVCMLGFCEHENMPLIYKICDIVVIPSLGSEGSSISCIEAMAMKKPIVVTNVGGLTDLIWNNYNGLVAKPNINSIAKNIDKYIKDRNLRATLGSRAYEIFRERHTYEKWCNHWAEFLEI